MARRSVRSQRKDMSSKEGKSAEMTVGIVSPTIMQNATMPPNALHLSVSNQSEHLYIFHTYNAHCATLIATKPDFPKQCSIVA